MKRGDILIAGVLLAALAAFAVPRLTGGEEAAAGAATYAEITVDGEPYRTVPLDGPDQVIDIQTRFGHNVLQVSDGGIAMTDADCPDKLCIGFGHVTHAGGKIVCLPNRVFVEIVAGPGAGAGDGYDVMVD